MDFRKDLVKAISNAGANQEQTDALLETPPQKEMGDFALPCFVLAKEANKNPVQFATELKEKIKLPKEFEKTETKGPYLNFFLNKRKYIAFYLLHGV